MNHLTREEVEEIVSDSRKKNKRYFIHAQHSPEITETDLRGVDLSDLVLDRIDFRRLDLREVNFSGAWLNASNFMRADLRGTNFSGAILKMAYMRGSYLSGANLIEADLFGVDFSLVDLIGTDFGKAKLAHVTFGNVDLRDSLGLETVEHNGPSYLDTHSIVRSQGQIPEIFLRGCGLSDMQIAMVRLHDPGLTAEQVTEITYNIHGFHIGKVIQYHSCFISYCSHDEVFAQRLHTDLQQKGVRCWFAPHDMPIGARIRSTIDESIRVHDKLLLVLSEHSVNSQWVEQEVETALARERDQDELVLFPVRLDNTAMNMSSGWPALIKNTRHIGDFSRWNDRGAYQQALEHLLRDLNAGGQDK